jgi:hypothetical protein
MPTALISSIIGPFRKPCTARLIDLSPRGLHRPPGLMVLFIAPADTAFSGAQRKYLLNQSSVFCQESLAAASS